MKSTEDFSLNREPVNARKFIIWCNNDFTAEQESERNLLIQGVGNHQLLLFGKDNDGREGEARDALQIAEIAFGYPEAGATRGCEKLLWIHLNSAGYTSFDRIDVKRDLSSHGTILTNSSSVYDEPCAQHLLAMILGLARGLPLALDVQRSDKTWQSEALRPRLHLLNQQTVLLLGFGAIARRLIGLLGPLEMKVIAVRREVKGSESVPVVRASDVDELLPQADHIVNVLPANEESYNFLNADRLGRVKPGAIVYNIGRGQTLDQDALMRELRTGRIAAAYLDVMDPEPLPPQHPLWEAPNCFITPHVGGGHEKEKEHQVRHFLENLKRFEAGESLHDRVL